eukprot:gene6473-7210_t
MAAFRKISHELAKRYDESSPENSLDLSESFKASLCSDEENVNDFEELEESSEELPGGKGLGLSQSSTKKKGKKGRKASWPDEFVNEMVEEICENEHFCRRLIFTNNKAYKNLEIYQKVVAKVAKKLMEERQQEFTFTAQQARTKFKACVAACKKASMTRRTKLELPTSWKINQNGFTNCFRTLSPETRVTQRWQRNHHSKSWMRPLHQMWTVLEKKQLLLRRRP